MKTASHALLSALCALCLAQAVMHAQTASISGTISYDGCQTGDVWVVAATNSAMPTNLVGFASVNASVSPAIGAFTNVAFTLPDLDTNKNYWLFAWRDSNTNGLNDTTEAKAAFIANPILLTNNFTDAVLTLADPDANNNGIPDWWEVQYGFDPLVRNGGFGDGSDGPLVVDAGQTNFIDTVRAVVTGDNPAGSSVLSVAATNGFRTNDLVLIIAMQDPNTDLNQNIAGRYEFGRVLALSINVLVLTSPLRNSFPATAGQRIQVLRVPQYSAVTVNGTLTCSAWNGTNGGVLAFLCQGNLALGSGGVISADGKGYRGGAGVPSTINYQWGIAGERTLGQSTTRETDSLHRNWGGGGAGKGADASGGGGGYGSNGGDGGKNIPDSDFGRGAVNFGTLTLSRLYLGGGGGGSGSHDRGRVGVAGGSGGGIVFIGASSFSGTGTISARGSAGENGVYVLDYNSGAGGGGGAGGSVYLAGALTNTLFVSATGGAGGARASGSSGGVGGAGGNGRIRIDLTGGQLPLNIQPAAGYVGSHTDLLVPLGWGDSDSDGLRDDLEYQAGTNPLNPDTDADGLPDGWEVQYGLNPLNPADATLKPLGDQLTWLQKYRLGLNPLTLDTDGDGLPDWWEVQYGFDPLFRYGGFGDGSDGPLVVNAGQTNFTDTVRAVVTGNNPAGSSVVSVAATNGFRANDIVLIIAMQDPNTDLNQNIAGRYEFARLLSLSNNALVLTSPLSNSFPATASQRIQVLRVPQYSTVTVNGTLTCSNWNGTVGGVLAFLAQSLTIGTNGSVTAEGKGFRGGPDYAQADVDGYQGESFAGTWANRNTANNFGGGGGGGRSYINAGNGGGGGGYGNGGTNGTWYSGNNTDRSSARIGGTGGTTYGINNLARLYLGSGGGSGGQDGNDAGDGNQNGGQGGAGGGVMLVFARSITNLGSFSASGQQGSDTALQERGYGGGGSGGSLWLATKSYVGNTNILALGGRGGGIGQPNAGGTGGLGRIRFNLLNPDRAPVSQPAPGYIGNLSEMPSGIVFFGDADADGLRDDLEYEANTNPLNPDTDGDGLTDGWEAQYGLNPLDPTDAALKPLGDQLTYLQKCRYGLNPLTPDTDGDGLSDYDELFVHATNPLNPDTDGDAMSDGWEVQYGLSPILNDAALDRDLDGLTNLQEYQFNQTNTLGIVLSPTSRLSATNGLSDYENVTGRRNVRYFYDRNDRLTGAQYGNGLALLWQYDGNGNILRQLTTTQDTSALPLVWRQLNNLTNATGSQADYGDADGDGWSNYQEWLAGSDPRDPASTPDTLGLPGTNIASLTLPFTPSNFVVGVGQLDGAGAEEIVVGADGDPGTNTNFLLILSQRFSGWTTQRVDIGSFGITSIAVGQPTNRPSVGIYLGLRDAAGTGRVAEVTLSGTNWTVNTIATSTNNAAFVLGLRSTNDLLVSLAATNAPDGALFSLAYSASLTNWSLTSFDTNTSSRGLGIVGSIAPTDPLPSGIRLLDSGGIRLSRTASPFSMPETAATSRLNWRGHSLRSGFPRASFTNLASVAYAYLDDLNGNGQIDEGDEFVLTEYQVSGTNSPITTLLKRKMQANGAASYGLAFVNYLNQTNPLLFTTEPDGRVFSWQATGATNALQSQVFSGHHAGKAWHALAGVQIPQQGEGLIGLRVSPASPNSCDVILWTPQIDLWKPANVPQTAPVARILPAPSSGGGFAPVSIRLWDGEGNASWLFLQYSNAAAGGWSNAIIASINGAAYGPVNAPPSGNTHQIIWDATGLFAPGSTNTVWLRVRARDAALYGDWSPAVPYQVSILADSDEDGLPDDWETTMLRTLAYDRNADPDHDGFANWQEYVADTDPLNGCSFLAITNVLAVPDGVCIQWQGGVRATQCVERSDNLGGNLWQTIFTNQSPTAVSGSYTDSPGTNLMRFYRIRATR